MVIYPYYSSLVDTSKFFWIQIRQKRRPWCAYDYEWNSFFFIMSFLKQLNAITFLRMNFWSNWFHFSKVQSLHEFDMKQRPNADNTAVIWTNFFATTNIYHMIAIFDLQNGFLWLQSIELQKTLHLPRLLKILFSRRKRAFLLPGTNKITVIISMICRFHSV